MIERGPNHLEKPKSGLTVYPPKLKHHNKHIELVSSLGKGSFYGRNPSVDVINRRSKPSLLYPESSIQQIKGKIRQFLTNHSETAALHHYDSEPQTPLSNKINTDQFRISIMKKNARKRVNLQFLDSLPPQRYIKLTNEVNISEMQINRRESIQKNPHEQFIKRKHRSRITQLKSNYERKELIAKRKDKVPIINVRQMVIHNKQEEKPEGWEALMEPWWEEDDCMELPTA